MLRQIERSFDRFLVGTKSKTLHSTMRAKMSDFISLENTIRIALHMMYLTIYHHSFLEFKLRTAYFSFQSV